MKLVEMKCKNCGAILKVDENAKDITCNYCNAQYKIDDEIQHVQYDNMHSSGYEFKRGRIQAQNEERERLEKQKREEQKRIEQERREEEAERARLQRQQSNVKWWALGWIFSFQFH